MLESLKKQWNENPMAVAIVGAAAVTAAAKLVDAMSQMRSRHAYAKYYNKKAK